MGKGMDLIDELQAEGVCYYISCLPKPMMSDGFFDFEEYYLSKYMGEIVEKISRIALTLVNYYDAKICLTQVPRDRKDGDRIRGLVYKNIRRKSLQELHNIIELVMRQNISSVQILISEGPLVFGIDGGWSTGIFVAKKAKKGNLGALRLLKSLAERENLYFLRDGKEDNL